MDLDIAAEKLIAQNDDTKQNMTKNKIIVFDLFIKMCLFFINDKK